MTSPDLQPRVSSAPRGLWLAAVLALRPLAGPLAVPLLRRRLAQGKEDPARWREKLGEPSAARPEGRLVWLHAVGLGEVLALRGLIAAMAAQRTDLGFLVTSTARTSARAFAGQMPARTVHQFLPLDLPGPADRFLDHWRPDLSVWTEQDLWPGLVVETARRGVPLALVNVRMGTRAFASRRRVRGLYRDLYARFALLAAQDAATAAHMSGLGAAGVAVTGSLKPGAGELACDPVQLARLRKLTAHRRPWLAASTHEADETLAISAACLRPDRLLILAPRDIRRAGQIAAAVGRAGLSVTHRSDDLGPDGPVWIVDTVGEMGLWYRLCDTALIGGQGIGGHNPWEAAALGCAVLHGPDTANFAADYAALHAADAAVVVETPAALADALAAPDPGQAARARALVQEARVGTDRLAAALLGLMR